MKEFTCLTQDQKYEIMSNRGQNIGEGVLLVSIRYWLPLGAIDTMTLSYLLLVATTFLSKWKVIYEAKLLSVLNRVRFHTNAFLK